MKMIPTVGRVVYLRVSNVNTDTKEQPFAALITHVNDDETINVAGWNASGCPIVANNCPLLNPRYDDVPQDGTTFAHWMEYQVQAAIASERNKDAQAARIEELGDTLKGPIPEAPVVAPAATPAPVPKLEEPDPAKQREQMEEIKAGEAKAAESKAKAEAAEAAAKTSAKGKA